MLSTFLFVRTLSPSVLSSPCSLMRNLATLGLNQPVGSYPGATRLWSQVLTLFCNSVVYWSLSHRHLTRVLHLFILCIGGHHFFFMIDWLDLRSWPLWFIVYIHLVVCYNFAFCGICSFCQGTPGLVSGFSVPLGCDWAVELALIILAILALCKQLHHSLICAATIAGMTTPLAVGFTANWE